MVIVPFFFFFVFNLLKTNHFFTLSEKVLTVNYFQLEALENRSVRPNSVLLIGAIAIDLPNSVLFLQSL